MTDYITVHHHDFYTKKVLFNPIHIHKRHSLSRLRIRSEIYDFCFYLDKNNKKIKIEDEEKMKVEDVLVEEDFVYIIIPKGDIDEESYLTIRLGDYKTHDFKIDFDANLSLIRSGELPNSLTFSIDNKYNFIDKAGNLIPLEDEDQVKARDIKKFDDEIINYYLEIELNPKFYREQIVLKKNNSIIAYLPGTAYKEPRMKYRELLKLKETEAFIEPLLIKYTNKHELLPSKAELSDTLLFSNLIHEENENVIYLTDLPEGEKVLLCDVNQILKREFRLSMEEQKKNKTE